MITLGDQLQHSNQLFSITDITDTRGGIRTVTAFNDSSLNAAFSTIPDKLKTNYSLLLETSTNRIYYLSGTPAQAIATTAWTLTGVLTNPTTGVGSNIDPTSYALQDGTILYHSTKWFVPTGTVSTSGTTVTSISSQFTSVMIGAKLIINGEWRIITGQISGTQVTVASQYSQNYSAIAIANWGVYSRLFASIDGSNTNVFYNTIGEKTYYIDTNGNNIFPSNFTVFGNNLEVGATLINTGFIALATSNPILWSVDANEQSTKDLGIRRNNAGILEIYDGVNTGGTLTNRRDLLVRNVSASKILVNATDDNTSIVYVQGALSAAGGTARGGYISPTLTSTANNDVLVGLDIAPSFNNGGFAGNQNLAVRSLTHGAKFNKLLIGSLTNPTLSSAIASATGGTLPAGTYYYKIVAVDVEGVLTAPSNELSAVTAGTTGSVALTWTLVQGASGYRVYKSNTSNTYGSYIFINGVNSTTLTDTNQATTVGSISTVNNSSYGVFDSGRLRTNNITLVNNGLRQFASLTFEKSTDSASINVVEYASDSTMFEFKASDNPDTTTDFFHWYVGDYQNPSSGWKPLKLSGFTNQFVAQNTNFWSSFNIPSSTPYYTTNADNLDNSAIKADPYTSTSYNLLKDNSSGGTGTLNVDVTKYTGTNNQVYWVNILTPTTFSWGTGSILYGTTLGANVTITGGAFQPLNLGVQIKLSASGHLTNNRWAFRVFPTPKMGIGTAAPIAPLQVSTEIAATSGTGRGVYFNPNVVATANGDTLVGLDIAPTFNIDGFTEVTNYAIRHTGDIIPSVNGASNIGLGTTRYNGGFFNVLSATNIRSSGVLPITFKNGASTIELAKMFDTGNWVFQNGGTFTDVASSRLTVNGTTQGFLPPRMTTVQKDDIVTPATGLIVYDTDLLSLYQFNGTIWTAVGSGSTKSINSISINTNAGSTLGTEYIYLASGTTTLTLPTAVGNTNSYTIKNIGTGAVTVDTTLSQTIDGGPTAPLMVQYTALTLISDQLNWFII